MRLEATSQAVVDDGFDGEVRSHVDATTPVMTEPSTGSRSRIAMTMVSSSG
jgi:hypothetical protein